MESTALQSKISSILDGLDLSDLLNPPRRTSRTSADIDRFQFSPDATSMGNLQGRAVHPMSATSQVYTTLDSDDEDLQKRRATAMDFVPSGVDERDAGSIPAIPKGHPAYASSPGYFDVG
ncbi:hypothetical protein IAR50_002501 [Cryptococcus sp. DSM 104548]